MICLFKSNVPDLYLTQIPNAVLHQRCKGEHPHKALGPLYFPTTISNHSSGTVTQQSVKEINNQIWQNTPVSLLSFICLTWEKKKIIKSLRVNHAVTPGWRDGIQCRAWRAAEKKGNTHGNRHQQRGRVLWVALHSVATLWPNMVDINLSTFADRLSLSAQDAVDLYLFMAQNISSK